MTAETIPAQLRAMPGDGFAIRRSPGDKGILFHHRRKLDDGELLLLVNTSIEQSSSGEVVSPLHTAEQWDLESGRIAPYLPSTSGRGAGGEGGMKLSFQAAALWSWSVPIAGGGEGRIRGSPWADGPGPDRAGGPMDLSRGTERADFGYFDVTAGGETKKNVYCYLGCQFAFQKRWHSE